VIANSRYRPCGHRYFIKWNYTPVVSWVLFFIFSAFAIFQIKRFSVQGTCEKYFENHRRHCGFGTFFTSVDLQRRTYTKSCDEKSFGSHFLCTATLWYFIVTVTPRRGYTFFAARRRKIGKLSFAQRAIAVCRRNEQIRNRQRRRLVVYLSKLPLWVGRRDDRP